MADWYVSSTGWTAIAQFATGTFTVGQIVRPLTAPAFNAQYVFRCTTAGTASAEPTWSSAAANNATVTATGGAVFTNVSGQSTYGWSAAVGNLYAISLNGPGGARAVAGDRFFLSSDHSESSASALYQITGLNVFGVVEMISVNRAGSVPPVAADILAGAAITCSPTGNFTLDLFCNIYWQGMTFTLGGSGTNFFFSSNGKMSHYFKNCAFVLTTSSTTANFGIAGSPCQVTFDNTTLQFNATGQRIFCNANGFPCDFKWINTPSAILGTAPTTLFIGNGTQSPTVVTCRGVDLSAITGTLYSSGGGSTIGKILLDSCRIASGVTRLNVPGNVSADEVELVNCFDGTNILAERRTQAGDVTTEFSTTMVGGATDNVGLFSHKMISSTRSDPWAMTLDSFWLDVNDATLGVSHTATVELIASSALNNNDVTLMLEYLGTASSSLASFAYSLASPLTTTAALGTSSATWNSPPSTPVAQHLQVTFTQRQAGRLRARVRLGKPSTTVWVNPQITVT